MFFFSFQLFGAYLSTSWGERNLKDDKGLRQQYFGTGETFLFKLGGRDGGSEAAKYPWVGLRKGGGAESNGSESAITKAEAHARELFMCGQHDMVAIGGG